MKLVVFVAFVATICCYADAGKTQRLLAALNGGMLPGLNGGLINGATPLMMAGGLNPAMVAGGLNPNMVAGGLNPAMVAGGLNPNMVAGGGAGFIGQPQFAQFVPAFRIQAPLPNVFAVPAVNMVPYMGVPQMAPANPPQQPLMGVPQMAPANPPQQPLMGVPGGVMPQQQLPLQQDPLRRFRRQTMKPMNTMKGTQDTQIPAPTESMPTAVPCGQHQPDH